MVGMKNEHVVMVVHDALAGFGEFANDVYERLGCAGRVVPRLSQSYGLEKLRLLLFYKKNLQSIRYCKP